MRFTFGRDTCTSITEWGGRDFSGLQSNGVVQNVMITVLHPPKTRGNYVDNKSVFEHETEIIIPRESEMQLLLYDEATDTYLAWECYD